ncbi:MAG: hypothetical protein JRG86_05455 [Deltaproteobacteria bacterium]|jgi:hypothetical protein|nr:hypothetical protein [Deltaproteobacteria bacterium]MBW2499348.1 hypothetical protein [Deltaproteobacteria bacterium]
MDLNTRALRVGSYQQFNQGMHVDMWRAWTVPGFESAVIRGLEDFHQLQEEDTLRFHWWIGSVMQTYDNAYYQYRAGMFDEDRWKMYLADLRQILSGRGAGTHVALGGGAAQWWRWISKENLSPDFVALVEEILGEEPEAATSATAR